VGDAAGAGRVVVVEDAPVEDGAVVVPDALDVPEEDDEVLAGPGSSTVDSPPWYNGILPSHFWTRW